MAPSSLALEMRVILTILAFSLGYGFLLLGFTRRASQHTIQFWVKYRYFEFMGVTDAETYRKIYYSGLALALVALTLVFAAAMVTSLQP